MHGQKTIKLLVISRSFLLRMKNVSHKSCEENQNTHFVFSNFFFENRIVCEIMWKNVVERGRPQMTIWRMRIACWIQKTTNTHSEYVKLILLPLQQCLNKCASAPHYTHIARFVILPCMHNLPNTLLTSSTPTTTVCAPLLSLHQLHHTNKIWCRIPTHNKRVSGSLSLRMARLQAAAGATASNIEGSCEYIEEAVADGRQGLVLQLGGWTTC
jgi:hypothetical protein